MKSACSVHNIRIRTIIGANYVAVLFFTVQFCILNTTTAIIYVTFTHTKKKISL